MDKKEVLSKEQQEKILKQVKHSYECEKMPLDEDDIEGLKKLLNGDKTKEELIAEEIDKMKKEGLIR